MTTKKLTKLLALYLPYILLGLAATNFGEAWRLAEGKELGDKIMAMMGTFPMAFANPLPSLHPLDLLVGLCCGAGLRLAVYLRGKNAKKYRHGMEYGSARWGTAKDIEPFMAPKFEDNIILTKTERLMMSNRPPDPKNAARFRKKNWLRSKKPALAVRLPLSVRLNVLMIWRMANHTLSPRMENRDRFVRNCTTSCGVSSTVMNRIRMVG